jgi:hypothetical protein
VELRGAQDRPGQPSALDQLLGGGLVAIVSEWDLVGPDDRDIHQVPHPSRARGRDQPLGAVDIHRACLAGRAGGGVHHHVDTGQRRAEAGAGRQIGLGPLIRRRGAGRRLAAHHAHGRPGASKPLDHRAAEPAVPPGHKYPLHWNASIFCSRRAVCCARRGHF